MQTTYENRKLYWLLFFTLLIVAGSYAVRLSSGEMGRPAILDNFLGPVEPPIPDTIPPGQQIEFWSNRLGPNTQDYITLTHLGRAYLLLARESGDASSYARAEEALRRALALNPRYNPAQALIGSVLIGQHNFAEALSLAQQALADNPDDYQALAVSGDASLEVGDYTTAESAYRLLVESAPGGAAYSRMSRLAWLQGRPDEAVDWMRRAADEAVALDIGGEELAWYRFQLGELYFNRGDVGNAQKWYDEARQALPGYYLARAGLGKVAAAEGRTEAAIAYYAALVEQLPQPGFIATLGDLHAATGDQAAAREQYDTVAFIQQLDEAQQVLHNRQMALFFANHNMRLDEALAYAEAELAARQDIYAYDTLAWVLYRLGRHNEAQAAMNQAMALGTPDAQLFYHAGMIAAALGDEATASANLSRALELNPNFDLIQAAAARETLATLSN